MHQLYINCSQSSVDWCFVIKIPFDTHFYTIVLSCLLMFSQAWKAERLMISGGSTSRCVFNVAQMQTARNRLHCMSICQQLGDLCSSVTYYDKICEISHTVDLSQCMGSRDGSYGTFIYQATSADDSSEIEMYNTTSTTTSRYEGSTEIREVMQRHARHNYSLTLGMFFEHTPTWAIVIV